MIKKCVSMCCDETKENKTPWLHIFKKIILKYHITTSSRNNLRERSRTCAQHRIVKKVYEKG